jgi:hypothetical protein
LSPRGPYPTRDVPASLLDQVRIELDDAEFTGRVAASEVVVEGGRVQPGAWAHVNGATLTIRYGHRAADLLDTLVPSSVYDISQVAALILAGVCGHPRGDEPGEPLDFVWTDHLALVAGVSLRTAFEISDVKTPQRQWLRNLEGRVRVVDLGSDAAGER